MLRLSEQLHGICDSYTCQSLSESIAFQIYLHRATRDVYHCSRVFEILTHGELFGIFHWFTLFVEEFDYTARVQQALVAVEQK